jgi:hypothetical protein
MSGSTISRAGCVCLTHWAASSWGVAAAAANDHDPVELLI